MNTPVRSMLALALVAGACSGSPGASPGTAPVSAAASGGTAGSPASVGSGGLNLAGDANASGAAGAGTATTGGTAAAGATNVGATGGVPSTDNGGTGAAGSATAGSAMGGAAAMGGAGAIGGAAANGGAAASGGVAANGGAAAMGGSAGSGEQEVNYAGYLFVYFTGEGSPSGEQIYMALSDGNRALTWQELGGGAPVLTSSAGTTGVRDPFIIRTPNADGFYLIATDLKIYGNGDWDAAQRHGSLSIVVWESPDLVTWSEPRLVRVAPETAGNTWAPEAFYDDSLDAYVVFWASKVYADNDAGHTGSAYNRMLYTTTTDFRTFGEVKVWVDTGYSVIDSTVIKVGDLYYRFTKDERSNGAQSPCGKFVFVESSPSLTSTTWNPIADCIGKGTINQGEGPLIFRSNTEAKWYLFIDENGGRGYTPFESTDLTTGTWTPSTPYSLPASPRHGTVLPVTAAEHQRLLDAYGGE